MVWIYSNNLIPYLEIEHLYLNQNQIDSNQNSEYGPDDDLDAELNVIILILIFPQL